MLPKKFRLKNKAAFDATYRNKLILSNENLMMYLGKEKKDISLPTKFGFVVSKKYHKRATKRNRIKRLMREACRLAIKNNSLDKLENRMSVIFIPRQNSLGKSYIEIEKSFIKLIEKIK